MTPRVLMWVQTRLGLGHLSRALTLCGALAQDGFAVTLAHGGPPVETLPTPPGVERIQLPAANAPDLNSPRILDADGREVDDNWRRKRIEALKETISHVAPHVFLTETFPLGRWLFGFELTPVLDWLHEQPNRPAIVASVRDVLTRPSKESKAASMIELARTRYDLVLCHGDSTILQLSNSFAETAQLSAITRYTGYVTAEPVVPTGQRRGVVVVAGGGAVGTALFHMALKAKTIWTRDDEHWTLVAGPRYGEGDLDALRAAAPHGVTIEGAVAGLAQRYAQCRIVVAQAGYNTVCEALSHGARLTVVPYATGKETEQTIRTLRLQDLGLLTSVTEASLTSENLARAMERALDAPPPAHQIDFHGGKNAARILRDLLRERAQ